MAGRTGVDGRRTSPSGRPVICSLHESRADPDPMQEHDTREQGATAVAAGSTTPDDAPANAGPASSDYLLSGLTRRTTCNGAPIGVSAHAGLHIGIADASLVVIAARFETLHILAARRERGVAC